VLPEFTAEGLIGLGVTSISHRRKLLAATAALGDKSADAKVFLRRYQASQTPRRLGVIKCGATAAHRDVL
jgi:hypothetical protein